jgi:hypothetical protein
LIFAGCETEADEKIVYLPGEMIRLDVLAANVTELKAALGETGNLAIGFTGSTANVLTEPLTVGDGKAIYILNGGTLKTNTNFNLTVKGVVYVGIGGILDVSAGNVVVDGGQVSVLPAKSIAGITADVLPGTLVIASDTSVNDGTTPLVTALGKDNVWIGGAVQYADTVTALTGTLVSAAFSYVQPGGAVNVGVNSNVAGTATVTVPAGKSLNVAASKTLTVAAGGSLILATASTTSVGKISGAGSIVAGATTITGAWEAVGTSTGTLTILSAATGATITATADATSLKASAAGATITQGAVASNNLTIGANTTIALGGTATKVGEIVLKNSNAADATDNGKLTLLGTITTGNPSASPAVALAPLSTDGTTTVASSSYTNIGAENLAGDGTNAKIEPTNAPTAATTSLAGKIVKLTGAASATIKCGDTTATVDGTKDGKISSETATVATT